jgi:Flp pilus assembly protein TadG
LDEGHPEPLRRGTGTFGAMNRHDRRGGGPTRESGMAGMNSIARKLEASVAAFGASERGNFALLFAAAASAIFLGAGFALNTAQLHNARSQLSQALDGAVTSTARDLTTGKIQPSDAKGLVETFLRANAGSGFMIEDLVHLDALQIDPIARTVSAAASVDVALAFPLFGTSDTRRVATESVALYSDKKIEVAMMLDITGSMAKTWRSDKIGDLKAAAANAVESLIGTQDPANARVRVSIVPYSDAVNVGADLAQYVFVEPNNYRGSEPPAYTGVIAVSGSSRPDNCATERKGATYQFSDAGPGAAMINRDYRLAFCPEAALQPLTGDKKKLTDTIASFQASGHTAGHIGIQWTRYMLSDAWASVLPTASRPLSADPKNVSKIAILMTDGEFNTAFADVPTGQSVRNQPVRSRQKAERLCEEMRKDGIEVFTIGFMLEQQAAKDVMRACASPDTAAVQHHYEAADGEALNRAFQSIVRNIERLAIIR